MVERNATPAPSPLATASRSPLPLTTPLVWAWGGVLLTVTTWLTAIIALFRSIGGLFS